MEEQSYLLFCYCSNAAKCSARSRECVKELLDYDGWLSLLKLCALFSSVCVPAVGTH